MNNKRLVNAIPSTPSIPVVNSSPFINLQSPNKKIMITILIIIGICLVIYLIMCIVHYSKTKCYEKKTFFKYLFDFSNNEVCITETAPVAKKKPSPPPKNTPNLLSLIDQKKEVFHISNQDYTYEQSKCKCESYNAKLATKAQIIDAYNNGAHWCTYGWADKQSAFYPVQQCEYDKIKGQNDRLPKNSKSRTYCGVPGINGGYFANSELKFGVNCYGVKPKGQANTAKSPYCEPMNFCKLESNYQASNKLDTDEISSFNNDKWNMN